MKMEDIQEEMDDIQEKFSILHHLQNGLSIHSRLSEDIGELLLRTNPVHTFHSSLLNLLFLQVSLHLDLQTL